MRTFLQKWLQKNPVQELRIVPTSLEESLYPRERCVPQRQTWRYGLSKTASGNDWWKKKVFKDNSMSNNERFPLVCRVLPLQQQKTLDTDLSVPEFQESVQIYQVLTHIVLSCFFFRAHLSLCFTINQINQSKLMQKFHGSCS